MFDYVFLLRAQTKCIKGPYNQKEPSNSSTLIEGAIVPDRSRMGAPGVHNVRAKSTAMTVAYGSTA